MTERRATPPRIGLTTTKPESDKFRNYVRAVEKAGGVAVPIVPGRATPERVLDDLDALVLTGGGDVDPEFYRREAHPKTDGIDRARDQFEIDLVRRVRHEGLPTLCVCRGLQVLNVAFDGTLTQHLPDDVGDGVPHVGAQGQDGVHAVDVEAGSHLARILGATRTSPASSHHQAIADLGHGLRVVARSPDDGVVEAVEAEGHPWLIGVQWHPERSAEPCQQRLFDDLVRAASEARAKRTGSAR